MFKSSFARYLTAFVIIIFVSFVALSSIITSIVRAYVTNDTEEKLDLMGSNIVNILVENGLTDIDRDVNDVVIIISSIVNFNQNFDVMYARPDGKIVISTANLRTSDSEVIVPQVSLIDGLGVVDFSNVKSENNLSGEKFFIHKGTLNGILGEQSLVYAKEIRSGGRLCGYIFTIASTVREDALVSITRKTVINSSIWVLLAAVIAAYFITEKMVKPLKNMTSAAKKFAKGDFTARVSVDDRKDEVAELGRAFNNMAESLDSLEKMRNSFLANISHDLRTPMTTIAGFIDGINSGAIPPEKHEYYLGVISAEVHRLSRLVSELLDVARLESGERKFNYTDFDIAEVARLILISFEQKIESKNLDVEFFAEQDEMYAYADKDAIYQVLYNLCHNAIKFANKGGKFRISLLRITDTKIKVAIYDEGQTISAEDSKMVFDRFYKTDKSRGLDKSGVGLGLYISKTIIDAHGETIGIDTDKSEGCEFWFTLTEGTQPQKRKMLVDYPH